MSGYDLRYNLMALSAYILREDINTPEQAFSLIRGDKIASDLTEEDNAMMVKLKAEGLDHKEIARMYGLSRDAVIQRIRYYKYRLNNPKKERSKFTTADTEKMIELKEQGLTYKAIAEMYESNIQTIANRISRYKQKVS